MNWQQEMAKLQREEDLFRRISEQDRERQLRRFQFSDPANHVEFEAERQRKAREVTEKFRRIKKGASKP